jgi:hypothetical protein
MSRGALSALCAVLVAMGVSGCGTRTADNAASGAATSAGAPAVAADAATTAQRALLEGMWVRTDEVGGGNFGGMFATIKPPALTPAAQSLLAEIRAEREAENQVLAQKVNGVYQVPVSCVGHNIVFMMQHSAALDIVLQADEVLIIPEHPGTQRIYMDGRAHPPLASLPPTGSGHSVGRWEGSVLVVDTIGMHGRRVSVPGGGVIKPGSRLVQRFEVTAPERLVVTFTWTDPELYSAPHSYSFTYQRQPADSYAFESWCDVSDPLQGQSIVVPPAAGN